MNNFESIYSPQELTSLTKTQDIQAKGQEIKRRIDLLRNYFHQFRNQIHNIENWTKYNKVVATFDQKWTPWHQKWGTILRTSNPQSYIDFFNEGIDLFKELSEEREKIASIVISHSDEVESLKREVLEKIDQDMAQIKIDVLEKINEGINNVVSLKAELGLNKNFEDSISQERENAKKIKQYYLWSFIASMIIISTLIILSFFLKSISQLDLFSRISIRLSIIPLGILSYFLFTQFKLHQLLDLKYTHLNNFLGGGATYISQLISQDPESKKIINQKIANMFMDINDLISRVKTNKHPVTEIKNKTESIVNDSLKSVAEITKSISNK
ncbi:hypothetical protein [Aureispira sp. CCB-E]|uniref:hypothetical protein n=1 Tax=Aureispira sp. CCB-E TaxID=3051121 RepID=UPI0028693028|nr:hypothetical protein [Aureispira sp. CCB-E]WMX12424.1 hypothetical protein QP953_16465 [Aureispira sp. CCB-E]